MSIELQDFTLDEVFTSPIFMNQIWLFSDEAGDNHFKVLNYTKNIGAGKMKMSEYLLHKAILLDGVQIGFIDGIYSLQDTNVMNICHIFIMKKYRKKGYCKEVFKQLLSEICEIQTDPKLVKLLTELGYINVDKVNDDKSWTMISPMFTIYLLCK